MADARHARQEIAGMFITPDEVTTPIDWWEKLLDQHKREGMEDAGKGVFNLPHPESNDAQDDDENFAYERGFKDRRKELGDDFKWHD